MAGCVTLSSVISPLTHKKKVAMFSTVETAVVMCVVNKQVFKPLNSL